MEHKFSEHKLVSLIIDVNRTFFNKKISEQMKIFTKWVAARPKCISPTPNCNSCKARGDVRCCQNPYF